MTASSHRLSRRAALGLLAAAPLAACSSGGPGAPALGLFAAASLAEVLDAAIGRYADETGRAVRGVYAGSAQLARQIAQGAPADLFISADEAWMEWLDERGLIDAAARRTAAANSLVLIAPASAPETPPGTPPGMPFVLERGADLAGRLQGGRLAMAEPEVPAGRYGREALGALGLWPQVEDRLALGENVRAALALTARGETPLGVVYATDARAEPRVRVVAVFPPETHTPIVYPAAPVRREGADAEGARAFLEFLGGPPGQALFRAHGFAPPPS